MHDWLVVTEQAGTQTIVYADQAETERIAASAPRRRAVVVEGPRRLTEWEQMSAQERAAMRPAEAAE